MNRREPLIAAVSGFFLEQSRISAVESVTPISPMKTQSPMFSRLLGCALSAALIFAFSAAYANQPGGGAFGDDVKLEKNGDDATLSNGIITAVVNVPNACVTSLKFKGEEMVSTSGRHTTIYFSQSGGSDYERPGHCEYSVTKQSGDVVDISCKHVYTPAKGDKHAWDMDVHFVLTRGATGLYTYVVTSHPASYPNVGIGEWRMVWSIPPGNLLDYICVDKARNWKMPSDEDFAHGEATPIKEITKLTTGPWAGKYDCKYEYTADLWKLGCWGFSSTTHPLGAWAVFGSHEFFNDGVTKNDLVSAAGVIHVYLNGPHYGSHGFTIKSGEDWQKIWGPYLLYFNDKPNIQANWADANAQAKAEMAAWPYKWLTGNKAYPLASGRGSVSGRFIVKDALKPKLNSGGALVGIAMPENCPEGNWQYQGSAYQYWVTAAPDGSFTIPKIRPGSYTLYAFVTGAVGEFSKTSVTVSAGQTTNVGDLTWNVPHKGRRIAWEIGIPDRSAAEFRHGNDYFLPYLYLEIPKEFPNPLEYYVSKGNWNTAWNYAHAPYVQDGKQVPFRWNIHYRLGSKPSGDATLTLAFASAQRARIEVYSNDESHPVATVVPTDQGGNALLREGIHAKYGVSYATIPASSLKEGDNVLTLVQSKASYVGNHVMYDYLNLELP